jgi:branched-chain amino acid transport system permease protein
MDTVLQAVILGIGAGALDALLAMGIVLVYRTTGVLNFAQSATGMFATYVMYSVAMGRPVWVALLVGIAMGAAVGVLTYRAVSSIDVRQVALASAVATLAIAILLQQAIRIGWGSAPPITPFPTIFSIEPAFSIGSVAVPQLYLAAVVIALAIAVSIGALLQFTRQGTMIRALADHPDAAELCGGNIPLLMGGVWAVSGALAAIAGFFVAHLQFEASALDVYFVSALLASVLGGLRSLTGAFAGACVLETAKNLFQLQAPVDLQPYAETFLIVLLIAVLVLAPRRWLTQGPRRVV